MAIDLGQIITDLGTEYIRGRVQPDVFVSGVPTTPAVQPVFWDSAMELLGYDSEGNQVLAPRKRRRRRRRLLTSSDFNDLAALKTLTGNNDAFKAAVIKAVRR